MNTTKGNQSLAKALQIIEVLAENKAPMRLLDIANAVEMSPSTVLRFLKTLKSKNYAGQDPVTLNYYPTMKFLVIGNLISSQMKIRDIVRPYLVEISRQCGESSSLAILQDLEVIYIDYVEGPDLILKTLQRIGKIAPVHSTGVGKCLMLNFDEKKIDRLILEKGLASLTEKTITTKIGLLKELEAVRAQDYALDDEECEPQVKCIAVPIRDFTGTVIASISVSAPAGRLNAGKIKNILALLHDSSEAISNTLGYTE